MKAHSGHPRLSDTMAAVIEEAVVQAGAPADLLRVIHGTQNGVEALKHPAIKAASFTGSISGGRALFDIATPDPSRSRSMASWAASTLRSSHPPLRQTVRPKLPRATSRRSPAAGSVVHEAGCAVCAGRVGGSECAAVGRRTWPGASAQ